MNVINDEALYAAWCADPVSDAGRAACEELYRRHRAHLVVYCLGLTRDWSRAEDCAEEAFVRLMRPRLIGASFRSYLWRTAHNVAMDAGGRFATTPPPNITTLGADRKNSITDCSGSTDCSGPTDCDDPAEIVAAAESRSALDGCLERLQPEHQALVVLRACQGFTFEEARGVLGWKRAVSTCKSLYDRALGALRRCLEKSPFSPEKKVPPSRLISTDARSHIPGRARSREADHGRERGRIRTDPLARTPAGRGGASRVGVSNRAGAGGFLPAHH